MSLRQRTTAATLLVASYLLATTYQPTMNNNTTSDGNRIITINNLFLFIYVLSVVNANEPRGNLGVLLAGI